MGGNNFISRKTSSLNYGLCWGFAVSTCADTSHFKFGSAKIFLIIGPSLHVVILITTRENILSHHYICYIKNESLQGEEQFHSKNYLLEMSRSHVKMRLKSAPQKLNFVMAKAISKCYSLDCSCKCPCTFPHSYA